MNTNNEFQLIWEYNLLRTFVRHIFMVIWNPDEKSNNKEYIYSNADMKGIGYKSTVPFILNHAIGIRIKENSNTPKDLNMFFKDIVNYSSQNSEETAFEALTHIGDSEKFVIESPEIRNVCEFDSNIHKIVDFIQRVKSCELLSSDKYSIFGYSIQTIANHILNLMKTSGYTVKSDSTITEQDSQKEPSNSDTKEGPFDMTNMSDSDFTDTFADMDETAENIHQFTLLLDTDEYFVRGVIVPMMAAYVGCDQLFELEQDKNAEDHLDRLYNMVNEQIDVNDHKAVLDYMSKVKFMISALLPNE